MLFPSSILLVHSLFWSSWSEHGLCCVVLLSLYWPWVVLLSRSSRLCRTAFATHSFDLCSYVGYVPSPIGWNIQWYFWQYLHIMAKIPPGWYFARSLLVQSYLCRLWGIVAYWSKNDVFFGQFDVSIPLKVELCVAFSRTSPTQNSTRTTPTPHTKFHYVQSVLYHPYHMSPKCGARLVQRHISDTLWPSHDDEILVQMILFSFGSCVILLPKAL